MKHNDIAIGIVVNQLMERSMKDSTPKKLATPMFEAAEIICQLLAERDKALADLEQVKLALEQAVAALKADDYCCDKCGWNPVVAEARLAAVRERLVGQE